MIIKYSHKYNLLIYKILLIASFVFVIFLSIYFIKDKDYFALLSPVISIVSCVYIYKNLSFNAMIDVENNLLYLTPKKFSIDINRITFLEPERRHDGSIKTVLVRTTQYEFFELKLHNNDKFISDMTRLYPHIKLRS